METSIQLLKKLQAIGELVKKEITDANVPEEKKERMLELLASFSEFGNQIQ